MPHGLGCLRRTMNLLAGSIFAALILSAGPAWADLSRDDAAAVAQRLSSGRVLSVDRSESAGRLVWRVKVLTAKGEVRVILIDAASGRAL